MPTFLFKSYLFIYLERELLFGLKFEQKNVQFIMLNRDTSKQRKRLWGLVTASIGSHSSVRGPLLNIYLLVLTYMLDVASTHRAVVLKTCLSQSGILY